jgi:CheY-like chemotaxis protein
MGSAQKKYRVFIVDDDENIGEVCALVLSAAGSEVETFCDGLTALQSAIEHPPDVVLTDFSMPQLDGITLARKLKEHCPACRILMMSGQAMQLQQRLVGSSLVTLLQKPLTSAEIVRCVQRALASNSRL